MDIEKDYQLINDTLNRKSVRLKFPVMLETEFVRESQHKAIERFKSNLKYVFLVYISLGLIIRFLVNGPELTIWAAVYISLGLIIGIAAVCSVIKPLEEFSEYYISLCAGSGLLLLSIAPALYMNQHVIYVGWFSLIYAIVVVYTMLSLRTVMALQMNIVVYFVTVTSILNANLDMQWFEFHQAFLGANILSLGLAYVYEGRIRRLYLQSRLLKIEGLRAEHFGLEMRKLALEMEIISKQDSLTGIANRRHFDEKFDKEWHRAKRHDLALSVMLVDIDFFKKYNDLYGHQKGDECLVTVAQLLQEQAQRGCDLAARYGGEEFILLFPETDEEAVKVIAERTIRLIEGARIRHEGSPVSHYLTVSIGIASCNECDAITAEEIVKSADIALYMAKKSGRRQWCMAQAPDIMH